MASTQVHSSRRDGLVATYQSLPQTDRQRVCIKTKLTVLMKRLLNMSKCSQSSRSLLVQMRDQLKDELEREGIIAPKSPFDDSSPHSYGGGGARRTEAAAPSPTEDSGGSSRSRETAASVTTTTVTVQGMAMDYLDCAYCVGFMVQPLCLPCGHSVCKSCLDKTEVGGDMLACPYCSQAFPTVPLGFASSDSGDGESVGRSGDGNAVFRRPTLMLQNALLKWYPEWVESSKHKDEGNIFANEGDFPIAVHWYSKALQTGVLDHRVLGNRSRAYLAMERLDEALQDAETACQLRPFWPKGHYRRAAVLYKQERWKEALAAYLLCLHLGCSDQSVVKTACHLLDKKVSSDAMDGESHTSFESFAVVKLCVDVMVQCVRGHLHIMMDDQSSKVIPGDLIRSIEFECVLCTGLLFCPITTPCGHSFCQSCLSRAFDHSPFCPICRASLAERFQQHCQQTGKMNEDIVLRNVLMRHFPDSYEEKRLQVEEETLLKMRVGVCELEELPIFVCTMAYPGMPCPLHIFEPRYRLMMRRCVEGGSRRFGMCQPAIEEGDNFSFSDYGTVLFINSVEYTPDGRSLITTTGERRFKVSGRSLRDGYNCAKINFLYDEQVTDAVEIAYLRALQIEVYEHAKKWLNALPHVTRVMIMQTLCSPLPPIEATPEDCPNGPMWVWWYIHALPTTPTRKIEFLKCTSLKLRLDMLRESLPVPV